MNFRVIQATWAATGDEENRIAIMQDYLVARGKLLLMALSLQNSGVGWGEYEQL
jgi:hypothetical protein